MTMESDDVLHISPFLSPPHRRRLRNYRERAGEETDSSDGEWVTATSGEAGQQRPPGRNLSPRRRELSPIRSVPSRDPLPVLPDTSHLAVASPRGRGSRRVYNTRSRRRGGSSSGLGSSPSPLRAEARRRRGSTTDAIRNLRAGPNSLLLSGTLHETDSSPGLLEEEDHALYAHDDLNAGSSSLHWNQPSMFPRPAWPAGTNSTPEEEDECADLDEQLSRLSSRLTPQSSQLSIDDLYIPSRFKTRGGVMKRSRDKFETNDSKDIMRTLAKKGAVSVLCYHRETPDPGANDVWPSVRNPAQLPARYFLLDREGRAVQTETKTKRYTFRDAVRPAKILKLKVKSPNLEAPVDERPLPTTVWPAGKIPTELYEEVASYLNRDDIKSMRLVCREFDMHISQVLFNTVVVPFNTEIYGMLDKDQKPGPKGKKNVKVDKLVWNNAHDGDVYDGHGLDVFRGFGERIHQFGMSFDVNEDSLARPPEKTLTENLTSFWGNYEWPYEQYTRFEDVAGLESAADETPRMKEAFTELKKVRELALSVDSGLGWLTGPDRSIRARILQRQPEVFGRSKKIPDRRAQAQLELWDHVESSHRAAESDVRLATLYKIEGNRAMAELLDPNMQHRGQPEMPYLDPRIINEAIQHDAADAQVPSSFDDPDTLDRLVMMPSSPGLGILFSSTTTPTDFGQLQSPIIPKNLTKAQKEWLLETEWAQRAFLSSYMLSIIDNFTLGTFQHVHTLNISQLSDRYLPTINRQDFWNALPSLKKVILLVIPGWRTVAKDEAGFVETPTVSPSSNINAFYELLRNINGRRDVVGKDRVKRCNIEKLTFGWVGGGEHAEGVHARNRNLLPAPLLQADVATEQDAAIISQRILQFPYVEELTLKNCWITPPVLRQLVQQHDKLSLKSLVLDSVSLTAMLRNPGNANHNNVGPFIGAGLQAGMLGGFLNNANNANAVQQAQQNPPTPQQLLQLHIQTTQLQIHHLQVQALANNHNQQATITALQTQLQQQLQLQVQMHVQGQPQVNLPVQNPVQQNNAAGGVPAWMQQGNNWVQQQGQNNLNNVGVGGNIWAINQAAAPAVAAAHAPPPLPQLAQSPQTVLKAQPREGSWLYLLDIISPGLNLSDFSNTHSLADSDRTTSLQSISFLSCGYAKLPYLQFDQVAIEPSNPIPKNPVFTKRYNTLSSVMLGSKFPLLAEIVQEVDANELGALMAGWYLETGWKDEDAKKGPEFDGLLPGGTGRFSGVVRRSDRVEGADRAAGEG
ncbi:uncharacterized protein BDR25DRAFT_306154 [Lindgomyces ingoldianus]|uniref:Uncharacterized protein n=1 Tax=Lindgomyces ingoldianus TaxID=673940 RepID=A0ACB6QIB4_9PLEO|nr:uncharacterized protein BDR25DRAFT_306154 [Lindgomyces ingoldianus]KAF2466328.1 hypothetical protein BDR25DRAFT_306154 [Lindgomyces ingoldianus]